MEHNKKLKTCAWLLIVAVVLLLLGCGTTKRTQREKTTFSYDSTTLETSTQVTTTTFVDTSRTTTGETIITEIEFFNPVSFITDSMPAQAAKDAMALPVSNVAPTTINISGVGTIQGNIKSIRQTKTTQQETEQVQRGESKQEVETQKGNAVQQRETKQIKTQSSKQVLPYWVAGAAMLLGLLLLLYIKRTNIIQRIRNILKAIRRAI